MGGKTKHVQRTKNNTKPSSSGRSAELLAAANIPSSVGFANVGEFGFLPTMLQNFSLSADTGATIDDMDAAIDTNYQLVFRKMMKKDPITKVKALQEFNELVMSSDVATVKSVLPFWPRLYNNLSTDVEHRVREAAQNAQFALVNKAGKSIAPYLKQIAPAWITSQYDTYAPAASVASASFQKAFPSHKLQDVFNFCQNEILDYVTKNLTFFTATTLSNPQSNSPEECEAKYQRVLICSLKGYAMYLSRSSAEHLLEASNKNTALVEHTKFWSYHKHKNASIRAAWFEALSAILQFAPELLSNVEKQAATSAMQSVDETESVVLPHAWTSVLLVTQKIANWQTYVNMEKALLPKLWKMLKCGGGGNAETIYPHLLPLLSKLDRTVLGDKTIPFYLSFFENINIGLTTRVVHSASSRADITAIATAYFECIQFVFIQLHSCPSELFDAAEVQLGELCERIFRTHLIGTIEFFLTNENAMNGKHVLGRLALLVRSWTDNCKDVEVYQDLLKIFWTEVFATIERSFATATGERQITGNLELIYEFVQQLGSQTPTNKSKTAKVKFAAVEYEGETDEVDSVTKTGGDAIASEKCVEPLQELVVSVCRLYMKKITETTDSVFISHLERLLKLYGSEQFFGKLAGPSNEIAKLYDKFASWLLVPQLRSENAVDVILMLYPYLNEAEKTKLLTKLIKFPNETVQYWILSRILSHPLCASPDVLRLLSHATVHEMLLKTAQNVVAGKNVTDSVNLLHKCFFQTENGDILIDCLTSAGIVEVLSQSLTDTTADENILDTCASFLAQIMPVICSDAKKRELQIKMFVRLFRLSVNREISATLISEDTLWEVVTSWQDALSSNDIELDDNLIEICSDIVQDGLDQLMHDGRATIADIESLAEIVSKLILCSIECCENEEKSTRATKIIDSLFGKCSKSYLAVVKDVQHACTFIELVSGRFGVNRLEDEASIVEGEIGQRISSMVHLAIYKFETIFKITCNVKKCQKAEGSAEPPSTDDEHTEDYCDLDETLLKEWPDRLYDDALDAIYAATLCNTLVSNSLLANDIEYLAIHLQERVHLFLKNISASNATVVKDRLFAKVNSSEPFWAPSALVLLHTEPYSDAATGLALLHNDLTLSINRTDHLSSYLNVLQSFTPKLPQRQLPIAANILANVPDLHYSYRCIGVRCLMANYFQTDFNETGDHSIVQECIKLMEEMYHRSQLDKTALLYNEVLAGHGADEIIQIAEVINFFTDVLKIFPKNITEGGWDFVRIAISSWVLTLSKSSDSWQNPKVAVFIAAVYKMFDALSAFIKDERIRSSSKSLTDVIDEWENVFAKDVNLILLKCFMKFVQGSGAGHDDCREKHLLKTLSACVNSIDFEHLHFADKIDSKTSIDDLIDFALTNLSHTHHPVRIACQTIIKRMSPYLIEKDVHSTSTTDGDATSERHYLLKFQRVLESHSEWPRQYIDEFNFKTTECDGFSEVPDEKTIPFLLLWDCVLFVCDHAPSELRSIYAAFIVEHKFEHVLLNLLFRLMPVEVLKNQDSKATGSVYFAPLTGSNIADDAVSAERYACYVYMLALKHLPAVVRKWWTDSHPRQKLLVDKITSVFVSSQLCNDELRALLDKKKKNDAFQITVHNSTREARATYVIDEARMELIIQLPINYPLGTVKVTCGQQIGDKLQSRVVVMQLSIFLTHQNGSIWDGLSLWKRNLDRKFEGVEECYVCYSVIHQETCQLPKLTCKTCKKRFHGQCLYKWFSTSNKSTCPICRNIF